MRKPLKTVALIAFGVVVCSTPTSARFVEEWPYDKLLAKADLVVFATATKTEIADDKSPGENSWNYEFVAQNTTFEVEYALKGTIKSKQIKVLHYKFGALKKGLDPDSPLLLLIIDGPRLVAFRTTPVVVSVDNDETELPTPEYLLFLKRRKDGRYEPVSGQIDAADSVKEVTEASDKVLGGN